MEFRQRVDSIEASLTVDCGRNEKAERGAYGVFTSSRYPAVNFSTEIRNTHRGGHLHSQRTGAQKMEAPAQKLLCGEKSRGIRKTSIGEESLHAESIDEFHLSVESDNHFSSEEPIPTSSTL